MLGGLISSWQCNKCHAYYCIIISKKKFSGRQVSLTPEISCMLQKSIQTTSGMRKHINNWWTLPVVFWVQICLLPREINSFLAAKDRRPLNTLQKALSTWQKSSFVCANTPWKNKHWSTWLKQFSYRWRQPPSETQSQRSTAWWTLSQPGKVHCLGLLHLKKKIITLLLKEKLKNQQNICLSVSLSKSRDLKSNFYH